MKEVFKLLGSNRGDRMDYLTRAMLMVTENAGAVLAKSGVYETAPWGFDDPIPFLNQVVEIETSLPAESLLEKLLSIEMQLGRKRSADACGCPADTGSSDGSNASCICEADAAYAGRTIDIDILFYGKMIVFTGTLMVPHPRLHQRMFTLVPLNEIAPDFIHPILRKPISLLVRECPDHAEVKIFGQ
jgi:2-amino-4-hydroxy-6-hydroxymethyldihydropteridine diphosphokinase